MDPGEPSAVSVLKGYPRIIEQDRVVQSRVKLTQGL